MSRRYPVHRITPLASLHSIPLSLRKLPSRLLAAVRSFPHMALLKSILHVNRNDDRRRKQYGKLQNGKLRTFSDGNTNSW
eukprot:1617434-Amphidinium_carterae.1